MTYGATLLFGKDILFVMNSCTYNNKMWYLVHL